MDGKLSAPLVEDIGVRQGHLKSSDHYLAVADPALDTFDNSALGFAVGPVVVSVSGVADDLYLTSDSPSGLQELLNIAAHYSARYRCKFGAAKTKIVITRSDRDMEYFREIAPWTINNENIDVVIDNEHVGLIVSGQHSEEKNV